MQLDIKDIPMTYRLTVIFLGFLHFVISYSFEVIYIGSLPYSDEVI